MKRTLSLILTAALLLSVCVPFAGAAAVRRPVLSASDSWTMGSGWMDCSTADDIVFQNTTETAGPNFNRNLIDGADGFRIRFSVEFLDPALQTTANVTLRRNSDTMSYFRIYATGRGDEGMFQVDYCNGGNWETVVPFVAGLNGMGGKMTIEIAREAAHNKVFFTLFGANGTELYSTSASSNSYAGSRFLDCGDLEFIVAPIQGYGLFRFSGYSVGTFEDDGREDPMAAADEWTMGANWRDDSDENAVSISNVIENAGPNFFKEKIPAGTDFRAGFLYTGHSDYTTADVTFRMVSNNNIYIRMLVTQDRGTALIDVNFYDGSNWKSLGSTGWQANVGTSYRVNIEHIAGTDSLRLLILKADGTPFSSYSIDASYCANFGFFDDSLEALVNTCGNYGLFTISGFTLHAPAVEAANWSMGANWEGVTRSDGSYAVRNKIENAGPNFYAEKIGKNTSFALEFDYTGISAYTTADITLRMVTNTAVYLRMLATQNEGAAYYEVNYFNGATWTQLAVTGWLPDVGSSYHVSLTHTAGTEDMTLTLTKPDGSALWSKTFSCAVCSAKGFFTDSALEPLVTTCGNYGLFEIGSFRVLKPVPAAEEWTLGALWQDAGGYGTAAIENTGDTGAGAAIYKTAIVGSDGVTLDFDFAAKVAEMQTTAELILRRTDDNSNYLRMVITARGTQEAIVETSYYNGDWIALDSSGWLSDEAVGGAYHVSLSHQAGAAETALTLTAKDGTVLYSMTFSNAAFTDKTFWSASELQLLFNPIPGYGCFEISGLTVGTNPPEQTASELWQPSSGWAVYPDGDGVYLAKQDKAQTEAVFTQSINGQNGFRVSFDIAFDRTAETSCYFKLRVPSAQEIYLFARVKGANNETILEAQSYRAADDDWSTSLLSSAASTWTAHNGTVTVLLERQARSSELRYAAIDAVTGQTLIDETFSSDVLTPEQFLDYNGLQWIFGADAGSSTFKIYHFNVTDYPADPVAAAAVTISGDDTVTAGKSLSFTALLTPADATVRSYEWLLDGVKIGAGKTVNCRFTTAGVSTVTLNITDYSGNVLNAEKQITVKPAPPVYAPGDVNQDEAVDALDAQCICEYAAGVTELTTAQKKLADYNKDGQINALDAYLILAKAPETRSLRAAGTLSEPDANEYRFNGHWVIDRSSFDLRLADWQLATFTDAAGIITAGTPGQGISYCRSLPEKWYAQVELALPDNAQAGLILADDTASVEIAAERRNGELLLTANGETQSFGSCSGTIRLILDNRTEPKLLAYCGGTFLGGQAIAGLSNAQLTMLRQVKEISFFADTRGTAFTAFGINDMIYDYENDPAAALALVEAWAKSEIEGSIVYANNGVPMYTPDGVKNYNALWTRDFTYMLEYGGDYIPTENAVACIEYLLEHVHAGDCWLPDRVYANGTVNYAAGDMPFERANLDNNSFIVIAMDSALSRMDEQDARAFFTKWESTLMTALDAIAKDENGLVWNDKLNPHSPYGFTDCVCKTGSLMKESLLLWQAYSIMAKWQTAFGLDHSVASLGAQRIEDALVSTFRNADGMLNAATIDCCQSDIWGSCYAVSIGFPMDASLKKSIADYIAANYDALVQMGQLRHTAPGEYWQRLLSGVNEGEYQNGAYWATPTGWLIDTLEPYYPALAMQTLQDVITYFRDFGIFECVNGSYQKLNHYGASISNILPAARRLLSAAPAEPEEREATLNFSAARNGDILTVICSVTEGSGLTAADLVLPYDANSFEPLAADGANYAAYADLEGALAAGAKDGALTVSLASDTPIESACALFTLRFRVKNAASPCLTPSECAAYFAGTDGTCWPLTVNYGTGEAPQILKLCAACLHIDEDINVIYAAEVPAGYTDPYMVFNYHDRDITVRDYTVDENGRYCFEFTRVMPQCLGDNIEATIFAKKNGKTVSDTVETYSVLAYCENQLAKTDDAKLIALLSDLLSYGAAAQVYTGYKTDALVTSGLDLTPTAFTALDGKKVSFTGEKSEAADWYSATLGLANDLSMRFTFTAQSVDGLSVDVTINGRTQTFTKFESAGDGRYAVTFRGIKATEFDDAVTAVFKQNGTPIGRTVTYSVNTYISNTHACDNASLAALVQALYNYGASAEAYAAK